MKIRLISDLHIDINAKYPLELQDDIFTLVAGDVSGYPDMSIDWIKKNIRRGAFICGNHDAYDSSKTVEDINELYHKEFPEDGDVAFLGYDVGAMSKMLDDKMMLVADVMYTDYSLPVDLVNSSGDVNKNMMLADPYRSHRGGMNDFNYGRCRKSIAGVNDGQMMNQGTYRLVPEYCLAHHKAAFQEAERIIESNEDKDIILMTHMGLSPRCLDNNYSSGSCAASYVSDKEDWIKSHPNIKCIFSGHVHCRKTFMVGDTLYAMNALGYCEQHLKQLWKDTGKYECWTPDCILDTDSWTVQWTFKDNEQWLEQNRKDNEHFLRYAPFFL